MPVECSDGFLPAGDPAQGILAGIGPLKWNNERPCWRLKFREGAEFRELGAELIDMTMQKPWRGRNPVESGFAVREFRLGERWLFTVWNPSGEPAAFRLRDKTPDSASILESGSESFHITNCSDGRIPVGNARLTLVEV